jgi:hypothetical protein
MSWDEPTRPFLPYIWPPEARTWVPDRSTHWEIDTALDAGGQVITVECRSLSGEELDGLLDHLRDVGDGCGVEARLAAAFVALCAGELGRLAD